MNADVQHRKDHPMNLWLTDIDLGTSGGHTLVEGRDEAEKLAREWAEQETRGTITIAPVRLVDEDDPELSRYDYDHESYFALTAAPEVIR